MSRHPEPDADYSFPHFVPHITLSSLRPTASETREWAMRTLHEAIPLGQCPVPVYFERIAAGDDYFHSIFVAIAPSPELVSLLAALVAPRQAPARTPYSPGFLHFSLYYIADEEAHLRVRLLQELERDNVVRHTVDGLGVVLECGAGAGEDSTGSDPGMVDGALTGFTGTQIWTVACEGPVERWVILDKILLANSDS